MTPMETTRTPMTAQRARRSYINHLTDRGYRMTLVGPSGQYLSADDGSHTIWIGWCFHGPERGSGRPDTLGFRVEVLLPEDYRWEDRNR